MPLSEKTYAHGYVHIHDDEENRKFLTIMAILGITAYSDHTDNSLRKRYCDNCGQEVREHDEHGNCPNQD